MAQVRPCLKPLRVIHKGKKKKSTKGHEGRRRATKGLEKAQEGSAKGWEGEMIPRKRQKHIHEGPRRTAKGHEGVGEGSRRIRQRMGRGNDSQEKAKRYPRRATKNGEGPRRGWRRLKRDPPKVGKGVRKGFQGVGGGSRGVRGGPRRTLRFSANAHSIIEPVSFLCSSYSSCLSCLSCVSMFNDAANRINGTWPLLPIGIRTRCFTLE